MLSQATGYHSQSGELTVCLRHQIATLILVAFAVFLSIIASHKAFCADRRGLPNIILILADDLGYAELGCYGQKKIRTPNLDRLAREGMRLTQFYSSAPVCAPARCCLMTGKHAGHAIIRDNDERQPGPFGDAFGGQYPLPEGCVTIPTLLGADGYRCGAFGKWGLGGVGTSGDPLEQGFDRFFGYNCQRHAHNLYPRYLLDDQKKRVLSGNTRGRSGAVYGPKVVADEMLRFIRQNKDRRFFVYYASVLPHLALQAPEEEIAAYRGKWPETPYTGKAYLPHPTPKACYAAMVSFLDKQIGRMMGLLEELELAENTVILFTSDNGTASDRRQVDAAFFASVGPLRGLKGSLYEGGLRVPLVARWPGHIPPNSTSAHLSAGYDLLPTLCGIAGIEPPADCDGVSFLPTLTGHGEQQEEHAYLIWDFPGYGGQLAVRSGDWKGVWPHQRRRPPGTFELYHLRRDPAEEDNVADSNPIVAARLEHLLKAARQRPEAAAFRFGSYGAQGARE